MVGGLNLPVVLPDLPDRVTLSARVIFCHLNISRWGSPPSPARIRVKLVPNALSGGLIS